MCVRIRVTSLIRTRDTARTSSGILSCSYTRTRVDDLRKWSGVPNVTAGGELRFSSGRTWSVSCFFVFPFFFILFSFNSTSDVYLHVFKLHRRVHRSRGLQYRSDSLTRRHRSACIHVTSIYICLWTNKPTGVLSVVKKIHFFFISNRTPHVAQSAGMDRGVVCSRCGWETETK